MKMKKFHHILVSRTDFLKKFLPLPNLFEALSSPLKKGVGWGRKLMRFHLKIYMILFNYFCVFLLEQIDVFWMVLLLPAIKNKKIIQNKSEDRQSVTSSSWARLTNPWKLFKLNKPTRELNICEVKILRWFNITDYTLQNTLQDHTLHWSYFLQGCLLPASLCLYSYSDRCKKFFLRYCFTIIVQISQN